MRPAARVVGPAIAGVGLVLAAAAAPNAQTLRVTPSLTLSEEYNDNIRSSRESRQADLVTGVTPAVSFELADHPWYVTLAGSLRSEFFADHSELNSETDNWQVDGRLDYRASRVLGLSLTESFVRSLDTTAVDQQTGIAVPGRFASHSNSVTPAVTYQLDELTSMSGQYAYRILRSESPDARDSDTHEAGLSLQRQLTPRITGSATYSYGHFQVESLDPQDSHSLRVGFNTALTATISISSENGIIVIREADGSTTLTWGSAQRYEQQFKRGSFSLSYDRQAGVGGLVGTVGINQTVTGGLTFRATRDLGITANASWSQSESTGGDEDPGTEDIRTQVYNVGISFSYPLLRWLSVGGGYRYYQQTGGDRDITRNLFFLSLSASDTFRLR